MGKSSGEDYDVAIIGGGPAGMSAALWCAELGLRSVLIEARSELGGQLLHIYNRIENYPGISAANGRELRDLFLKSLEGREFDTRFNSPVTAADLTAKKLTLETGEIIHSKTIIIATGVRRRKLGVPSEDEFLGRGILTSGAKEAETVRGKSVLIIGGGDAALENALILAKYASQVTVVHRRDRFTARHEFLDSAAALSNVELMPETLVQKFDGNESLESAELYCYSDETTHTINIDHALIRIGVVPNTEMFREQINTDNDGYLNVTAECETNLPEIYAVGDVANQHAPTIASASGKAATAVKLIAKRLNKV